jgi:hypothetical protein
MSRVKIVDFCPVAPEHPVRQVHLMEKINVADASKLAAESTRKSDENNEISKTKTTGSRTCTRRAQS